MIKNILQGLALLALGVGVLFLDFLSKAYVYYVVPLLASGLQGIVVFTDFLGGVDFSLNLALNRGAAWGLFANFQIPLLIVRMFVILGMALYLIFFNRNPAVNFPFVLICAGAIGNVVDFFLYGYVIDFFHFNLWGYHFPVFNVADCAITAGVLWLLALSVLPKKEPLTQHEK